MRFSTLLVLSGLLMAGCASMRLAAPRLTPAQCATDSALVGTWSDSRMTQMGPAWIKVSFRRDCSFDMRIQMLWLRVTERGQYRAAEGRIQFERESGQTIWPYRLDGGRLHLTEFVNETHTYHR